MTTAYLLWRNPFAQPGVPGTTARWIAGVFAATFLVWLAGFAGLLAVANRVHVDIPEMLARRLPVLQSHPMLIFAGESRTEYGVDPILASRLLGKPDGYAANIAYDAGEPLAFAATARAFPQVFREAHAVISVGPFIFNEGVRSAHVYPLDVAARMSVQQQLTTFLPLRIGTLIRYIGSAFSARLANEQGLATYGPLPPNGGLSPLEGTAPEHPDLGSHSHYRGWDISGPKAHYAITALCELARLSAKLTVVEPPWVPGDRSRDAAWLSHETETVALLQQAGTRCGFTVLNITAVPGLTRVGYADEMHVNRTGVPIYTRDLVSRLMR